ncbi:MAG: SpoVA/SpoVAEb family sporulation membrane protein [Ruminococcus sp.]|nr:SpoVA/SpoVAEb family sporulation membrane protein [Ruminococcus sp.]
MQYIYAFLIGGTICLVGQLLIDKTMLTPAKILTGFVVAGVLLSALGLYQPLIDFAGEGAAAPICGFGNLMVRGMKDALREDGALGILTGALKSAAGGIGSTIVLSLICGVIGRTKGKI